MSRPLSHNGSVKEVGEFSHRDSMYFFKFSRGIPDAYQNFLYSSAPCGIVLKIMAKKIVARKHYLIEGMLFASNKIDF